ncbi:ABC transporter ATP-binding protein [Kitasatospora aureofaciens]|uniref:ABC transporter ATP-binding protein n=1 Tax=Kitasatospora aureofaciens TaxID=1894 RepID=UPI0037C873D4
MTAGLGPMVSFDEDAITKQVVKPGTLRRILPYALRYRWSILAMLLMAAADAAIAAASPLLLKRIIDEGLAPPGRLGLVVGLAATVAALALVDALVVFVQSLFSGRISEGLVYDLRTAVFTHVQRQPLAFFTRTQTGALVSRIHTDIVGARQAVTTLLSQAVSAALTLLLVLAAMFYLSWQITLAALLVIPFFLLPARVIGRRIQRLARAGMQVTAEMGSVMNERFNVSGAMLTKLYGRPDEESALFARQADKVRGINVSAVVHGRMFGIVVSVLTAVTTALVYGFGGSLVLDGTLRLGVLVAMVTLLLRLYGPINQLSGIQIDVMTALVSFDRVFEVLDLKPLIEDRPDARPLAAAADGAAPDIEFDRVSFRYPAASLVSLASLESPARRAEEDSDRKWILRDLTFRAPSGKLTALVGPSGAGKTTITGLVPRLYDPDSGTVRVGGADVRDLTAGSLTAAVGVVTQDAHMFHDTIRANLAYARPGATEQELVEACRAARIWDTIAALPEGLDTVVGDRGHRLSGGEKQRLSLARLLLKAPPVVILDEATAHLDSESEAAIQRALKTALAGRTSLVIAHRLSTVREADQILVVDGGRVRERGTHQELLDADGLYAELYRTQFAAQETRQEASEETSEETSEEVSGEAAAEPVARASLG